MGTLTTKSKSLSTQAEYEGQGLKINVVYNEDAITSTLRSLNGNIYKSATGTAEDYTYAGNFDGKLKDGDIEYSLSQVKSADMPAVTAALADIEAIIREQEQPVNGES